MSSFGGFSSDRQQMGTVSEINMIPLIDVMLVLLIIFMITAPLLTHSIKIDVPRVTSQPAEQDPESIDLAIKATGEMYWNNEQVDMDQLREKMTTLVAAQEENAINLRIRADGEAYYEQIAQVMAAARSTGVRRLGFITTPDVSAADKAQAAEASSTATANSEESVNATTDSGAAKTSATAANAPSSSTTSNDTPSSSEATETSDAPANATSAAQPAN